jgi:hypothetical protein
MMMLNLACILAAVVAIAFFSMRAVRTEQRLWQSCRRRSNCLRQQRQITLGKSHCR